MVFSVKIVNNKKMFKILSNLTILQGVRTLRMCGSNKLQIPIRNVSKKFNEGRYKVKDQLGGNYSLIYKAPMELYLLCCAHVTSFTVIVIGIFGAFSYRDNRVLGSNEITYGGKLITNKNELGYFISGFLAINLALRVMVNRYPLRIYKEAERYTAVFSSQMNPLKNVKLNFLKGDVNQVAVSGILPWRECRYTINKKKIILLPDYFKTPSELHKMMNIEKSEFI